MLPLHTVHSITTDFPPPPRRVRRTIGSACAVALPRLFLLPHTLIGIMLLLYAPVHLYVDRFGTPVIATIDHHEIRTTRKGSQIYQVNYHFSLNGKRCDEYRSVGALEFANVHDGDTIQGRTSPLIYLTLRFQNEHFFAPPPFSDGPLVMPFLISIFWNILAGPFVWRCWVLPWRQRRLVRNGSAAPGLVTMYLPQKRGRSRIIYSFITNRGNSVYGRQEIEHGARAQAGMPCTVIYDPRKPSRNIAYEFSGLKIVG